jgi:hypothetical protein
MTTKVAQTVPFPGESIVYTLNLPDIPKFNLTDAPQFVERLTIFGN